MLGPDGVGKSTLARVAAERFTHQHPNTLIRWVTGTPTERAVPFGAFSHLVEIAEIGKPAALLRAARASLGGDELLLVVDDAQHLDVLSATLVYQLARDGAGRLIVTARADPAPEAIAALWNDGLLTRIDIEPPAGAIAPAEIASSGVIRRVVTGSLPRICALTSASTAPISSRLIAFGCEKSKRK